MDLVRHVGLNLMDEMPDAARREGIRRFTDCAQMRLVEGR